MGSKDSQTIGLVLAVSSSIFIGSSFILKKRGLRIAAKTGTRAGAGGFSYLTEPTWWTGLLSMVLGEVANFAAYAFAPAMLVTPLGALSIIVSAVLAALLLEETLNSFGVMGCWLCIVGSITVVINAPQESPISSVSEIMQLALQPGFLCYTFLALLAVAWLVWSISPIYGRSHVYVYIIICSIMGSLSVMSCKALGLALKLTFEGNNQMNNVETYYFLAVVVVCVLTQMNYLNKALDLFNTAIVSPIYYVFFTMLTLTASMILFKDPLTWRQIATEMCGFATIVTGVFLLHATKDFDSIQGLRNGKLTPTFADATFPTDPPDGSATEESTPFAWRGPGSPPSQVKRTSNGIDRIVWGP